jgi:radical SAM protein with 4Fe4S-binding SPASM domain
MDDSRAREGELSYEEHCRILDEITEAGCLWLLYTGGEVFARRDFLDIYLHAKKNGLLVSLFTNGTLITPRVADSLAQWTPFSIEVTLYGRTKETYERLTGTPGSFNKCMRGIRLLTERRLPLKIKTMAVSINKHEIWEMKRFVEEDLGLEFRFDASINPRIDCSKGPLAVRLSPAEVVELDLLDPARIAEWKRFARQFNVPAPSSCADSEVYQCGAGINSFSINPHGKMSICVLSQFDTFDLRKGSFRTGWEGLLWEERRKKVTRMTKCVSCEIKSMCGMCPANGALEQEDPESPVDFLCQVAHLRSYALEIPIPPHGDCAYCEGGDGFEKLKRLGESFKQQQRIPEGSMPKKPGMLIPDIGPENASSEAGRPTEGCLSYYPQPLQRQRSPAPSDALASETKSSLFPM